MGIGWLLNLGCLTVVYRKLLSICWLWEGVPRRIAYHEEGRLMSIRPAYFMGSVFNFVSG